MRTAGVFAIGLAAGGQGCAALGGRSVESLRAQATTCQTRVDRPIEQVVQVHQKPTTDWLTRRVVWVATVELERGEQVCLYYGIDDPRYQFSAPLAVDATRGPAIGLTLSSDRLGVSLWINNQTSQVFVYTATVAIAGQGNSFDVPACPVPAHTVSQRSWAEEVVSLTLYHPGLVSSAPAKPGC